MQTLLVFMIVGLAAVYAFWKYTPRNVRVALAKRGAALVQRIAGLSAENVRRLESKLASGGACGSCDSCNACASKNPQPAAGAFPVAAPVAASVAAPVATSVSFIRIYESR